MATLVTLDVGKRCFASGVKCTISYANVTYGVDSDFVYPYAGDADEHAPAVLVQRDLADFDWEDMALLSARRVALHALDEAFLMCFDSVKGLAISQEEPLDVAPFKLRVRTKRAFRTGELVLTPYALWPGW